MAYYKRGYKRKGLSLKDRLPNSLILLGVLLILISIFINRFSSIVNLVNHKSMTLNSQTRLSSDVIAVPKYIEIPGKLKKLPIIAGSFKNDQWDLATNSALYLQGSESEDFGKNTVIYGHDINSIFAPLSTVQLGDFIRIETSKNLAVNFKVIKIEKVLPNDVSILSQDYNNQLTLFTCTGLFDSMRLVIISKKIG